MSVSTLTIIGDDSPKITWKEIPNLHMDLLKKINHQKNAQRITFEAACALKSQNSIKKVKRLLFVQNVKALYNFLFANTNQLHSLYMYFHE
jgi:hypothetical protein